MNYVNLIARTVCCFLWVLVILWDIAAYLSWKSTVLDAGNASAFIVGKPIVLAVVWLVGAFAVERIYRIISD